MSAVDIKESVRMTDDVKGFISFESNENDKNTTVTESTLERRKWKKHIKMK
jgi:hypothetical protein